MASADAIAGATICSKKQTALNNSYSFINHIVLGRSYPFQIGVTTDNNEICSTADADMGNACEAGLTPGGILGFALGYSQGSC